MTRRSLPEWIGATPDSAIPARVKLRVFLAHHGICHISGQKIAPGDLWDADHILALCNGGENREGNLAPALRKAHRQKTATDVGLKSKADRLRKKHIGIKASKAVIPGSKASPLKQKLNGETVRRDE